jgi:hypothetical protein
MHGKKGARKEMSKRSTVMVLVVVLLVAGSGCVSLSRTDKATLRELRGHGIRETDQRVKHPAVAGGLNILPGIGNFYLACGTDESEQWVVGFMNLLFWPISILWGIPEAAIDANTLNQRELVYYYMFDPSGKAELKKLREDNS